MTYDIEWYDDEEWLEASVSPAYFVSTRGRIYSTKTRRLLQAHPSRQTGRMRATLTTADGGTASLNLAQEVLSTFGADPRPRGGIAAFRDGDAANCSIENLYWVRVRSAEHEAARAVCERAGDESADSLPESAPTDARVVVGGDAVAARAERVANRPPRAMTKEEIVERNKAIRQWAARRGIPVSTRGKIAGSVIEAYARETGETSAGKVSV